MTESENFRNWLLEPVAVPNGDPKLRRELLSLNRWCSQIGYDASNFSKFLAGKFDLPEPHRSNMVTIAEGFGYKPLTNQHHFL